MKCQLRAFHNVLFDRIGLDTVEKNNGYSRFGKFFGYTVEIPEFPDGFPGRRHDHRFFAGQFLGVQLV